MNTEYGFNIFWSKEDEGYIATCPDFPGLMAFGETYEEAAREASGVLEMFIESYKERGKSLPEATVISEYSGQTRLRMPKSLHKRLSEMAEREGVSFNAYVLQLLSEKNAINELAKETVEQFKKMQRQMVTEIMTGSEDKRSTQTSISYTSQMRSDYNVHTSH